MLRNVCIVLVLTALTAVSAVASPVVPAKTSKLAHHKTIHAAARATRRAAARSTARASSHRSARPTARSIARPRPAAGAARTRASRRIPLSPRPTLRRASLVRHRFVFPPSPLKGSLESLTRQNERAEADGLERILDEQDLAGRIEQKLLVPVPESSALVVNSDLTDNHRYCRPWTATFLTDLSREHEAQFHKALTVSSAVRTVEYQQTLMRHNHNAAAAEGDVVSPHLTGATIDIAKSGMSRQELGWMRNRLLAMQEAGLIDVEEEFRQPCFHITVYKSYAAPDPSPAPAPSTGTAQVAGSTN